MFQGVYMLKKLVKYGNSNALVFDKAILELLNIKEGSVVKISTDGKALTITPHEVSTEQAVSSVITPHSISTQVAIRNKLKSHTDLSEKQKDAIAQEYQTLMEQHYNHELNQLPMSEYVSKVQELKTQYPDHLKNPEFFKALRTTREKYVPHLVSIEDKIKELDAKYFSINQLPKMTQEEMVFEFGKIQKKYATVMQKFEQLIENPDYLHETQLLAEKYAADKNSEAYMKATMDLRYKYIPEAEEMDKEMKAVC